MAITSQSDTNRQGGLPSAAPARPKKIGSKFRGVGDEIATITGFRRNELGKLIVQFSQHDRWSGGTYHGEDFALKESLYNTEGR